LKENFGEAKSNFILYKSSILRVSSSNNIANTYFASRVRKLQYDVPTYTDMLVQVASSFVKVVISLNFSFIVRFNMELYGLGARRIGVFCAPPLGCLPFVRSLFGGLERMCNKEINMTSKLFNSKLSAQLHNLKQIKSASSESGYEVVDRGCCSTGIVETAFLCNLLVLLTCIDDSNAEAIKQTFPALILFEDSIVDTGHNNHLITVLKCNFPPYAKDSPDAIPTGSFSYGRVPSDFLAISQYIVLLCRLAISSKVSASLRVAQDMML
ncbi:GDSL esterase/lipase, partial [Mucuna pruriens]